MSQPAAGHSLRPTVLRWPQPVKGNLLYRARKWLELKWFQYEITFGVFIFDSREKVVVHLVLLLFIVLINWGLYKQVQNLHLNKTAWGHWLEWRFSRS